MTRLLSYLILPSEVTPFERRYLQRVNKIALGFFWLHPPVFVLIAILAGTRPSVAFGLALAAMVGPMLAYFGFPARPRLVAMIYGVTAMLMAGILVYIGQGPMQIEMHFYFFVLIALLAVFGNPFVILVAAATVAGHHFVMWLVVPRGVFNYDATIWSVVVHAAFVVIESVAACFVARSFFDNVIGLEKIVTNRTRALDARNQDMARILDNVAQGFVSAGFDGTLGTEWSKSLATWFGEPRPGVSIAEYLFGDSEWRFWMEFGLESLRDGSMPFEIVVMQWPYRISRGGRELRVDYRALGDRADAMLVVVSDITDEVARQRAEAGQRELVVALDKASRDRAGFASFLADTDDLVRRCTTEQAPELVEIKRNLHTLKGNTALFGVTSIATLCHELEDRIAETEQPLDEAHRTQLVAAWDDFRIRIEHVLGRAAGRVVVIDWDDYYSVASTIAAEPWATRVRDWGMSPTRPRLEQCGEYARMLADRLGKPGLEIEIADNGVRLFGDRYASVWPTFIHAVRNMVDHGIESPEVRASAGKRPSGQLVLATAIRNRELWFEISDDGAGIDWDRVRLKAAELGVRAETQRDLEEALFAIGVSTASSISDVSGRGVGMEALRSMCWEYGGRTEVRSETGRGTRISCVLPLLDLESPVEQLRIAT